MIVVCVSVVVYMNYALYTSDWTMQLMRTLFIVVHLYVVYIMTVALHSLLWPAWEATIMWSHTYLSMVSNCIFLLACCVNCL